MIPVFNFTDERFILIRYSTVVYLIAVLLKSLNKKEENKSRISLKSKNDRIVIKTRSKSPWRAYQEIVPTANCYRYPLFFPFLKLSRREKSLLRCLSFCFKILSPTKSNYSYKPHTDINSDFTNDIAWY